jgi:hypothetical protein
MDISTPYTSLQIGTKSLHIYYHMCDSLIKMYLLYIRGILYYFYNIHNFQDKVDIKNLFYISLMDIKYHLNEGNHKLIR